MYRAVRVAARPINAAWRSWALATGEYVARGRLHGNRDCGSKDRDFPVLLADASTRTRSLRSRAVHGKLARPSGTTIERRAHL